MKGDRHARAHRRCTVGRAAAGRQGTDALRQRGVRGGVLVQLAVRGRRRHQSRGAHRRRPRRLLLDAALRRPGPGRSRSHPGVHHRQGPPREAGGRLPDPPHRAGDRGSRPRHGRRRLPGGGRGRQEGLPGVGTAGRRGDHPERHTRQLTPSSPDRYVTFTRDEWARLRAATPLSLTETELETLRGINERISMEEVAEVYLPLARLLHLYVEATTQLSQVTDRFLGKPATRVPYVVAIAGSVAVGKSTTARLLQALLARFPEHPRVDLVTTDGFLYPNKVLAERGLMTKKGFPESYDLRALLRFLADVKAGVPEVAAPLYSHLAYDIVDGGAQVVCRPDVVIVEGLNVLQGGGAAGVREAPLFVSDFFDFSVYVDADETDIEQWYLDRFLALRETTFRDPASHFHTYASLADDQAVHIAREIWREINGRNLADNILPTR